MLTEIQEEWCKRLESGTIKQGKNFLGRDDGSRCCLGVLSDMAVEANVISKPEVMDLGVLKYDGFNRYLPESVKKWARIEDSLGSYKGDKSLGGHNDAGKTFSEIAAIIRSEPDGLFRKEA